VKIIHLAVSAALAALIALPGPAAEPVSANQILAFPAPDALTMENGKPVRDGKAWYGKRRGEILNLFVEQVYGRTPAGKPHLHFKLDSENKAALGGKAVEKQVTIFFSNDPNGPRMHLLLFVPAQARKPVPVFTGLNFEGNQTVDADPAITLGDVWVKAPGAGGPQTSNERARHVKQRATEQSRGKAAGRWQVENIVAHGYALATAYYGDIEPDFDGGFQYGVRSLYLKNGQTKQAPNEWGALGAWAWGLSRAVDYLQTDHDIDPKEIIAFGHSRLGKAAVWAGAQDKRFAMVISNESGVGGVSLYRAKTGETIEHLNTAFPHWFCENFHQYTNHPDQVPVDGNLLVALIAPRPLYIASAEEDHNSNPQAEFLSAVLGSRVYQLLGTKGLGTNAMPPLNHAVMGTIAYHERTGKHDVTAFDWEQYVKFADMHFRRQP
jgi:hypothetical protein